MSGRMDPRYVSPENREVPPAAPGEFPPLRLGPLEVWPPVVLAPMAGVTNYPFRALCRRFGAPLCVSEMITARALVRGDRKTRRLAEFGPEESPRSLQLYGVDPLSLAEATRILVGEGRVDHLDLNFGCPVRKVTIRGGGAAVPLKPRLLARLVRAVVGSAGGVPVTMKFRMGVDEEHLSYRSSGRVAEAEGAAAVCLHARTAAQLYGGEARWEAIAELAGRLSIPVIGNGDVYEGRDALRMMRGTGCAGVAVGRGCLGRPWLFRDLADLFEGREPPDPPRFGEVADLMREHAARLGAWIGEERGILAFRKFTAWYTKGFPGGAGLRRRLTRITSREELDRILSGIDRTVPFPPAGVRARRGKRGGARVVRLPEGYLENLDDDTPPGEEAGEDVSGG